MELDRQPWPEQDGPPRPRALQDGPARPRTPQRVPETRPTPLQEWFIYLSIVVLVCGVVVITALEMGARLGDPVVRLPLLLGAVILIAVAADALLRVWRSAWAWLPVDRGRGLVRFIWSAVLAGILVAAGAIVIVGLVG